MDTAPDYESGDLQVRVLPAAQVNEGNHVEEFNPFKAWEGADAPKDDEQNRGPTKPFVEEVDADGKVTIKITPMPSARAFAAVMAGTFVALQETNEFSREEALRVLLKSMGGVILHMADGDDDDDE